MWGASDSQKLGVGFCVLGTGLGTAGVCFLFDRALLSLGNLCFLSGLMLLMGMRKTVAFFFLRPQKWKASCLFFAGVLLIFFGYALLGLPLQLYALLQLCAAFLPQVLAAARLSPIGSWLLSVLRLKAIARWVAAREKENQQLPY